MGKIRIEGGHPLHGDIEIQGAKNAVLPMMAGTLLNSGQNTICGCPKLKDVEASLDILRQLGCTATFADGIARVDSSRFSCHFVPESLMHEMRSSIIFLGAILARCKEATLSYPGGCELGPRPIDLHLKAFRQLGVHITEEHGFIHCDGTHLCSGVIHLDFPSVGATENIMLLSCLGNNSVTIFNAAREPEIVDLQNYLNKMGGSVTGAGTSVISVSGTARLHDVSHTVMPDRIVAASYLIACAIVGGEISVRGVDQEDLQPVLAVLRDCGCVIEGEGRCITLQSDGRPKAVDLIRTMPHPGFPTDAQALISTLLAVADGTSMVEENMFENRFKHMAELCRMGADIKTNGRVAVIKGVERLSGARVTATDLRGAAALIIAGLQADGITEVDGLGHLDRGYQDFEVGLRQLGAVIERLD